MKRFAENGSEVWVGFLPELGIVVYDPLSQEDISVNRVRLYVYEQGEMVTFVKDIVRERLRESAAEDSHDQLAKAAEFYQSLRHRSTHCFSCKEDFNSLDFAVCAECGWIRCVCGACGCSFHG